MLFDTSTKSKLRHFDKISAAGKAPLTDMENIVVYRQFDKKPEGRRHFDLKYKFKFKRVVTFGRRRVEASGERKKAMCHSFRIWSLVTVMLFVYK